MTCPHLFDVAPYALGTLEAGEREATAAHVAACAQCRTVLDSVAALPALLARVEEPDLVVPRARRERLVPRARRPRPRQPRLVAAALLAVGLLAGALGWRLSGAGGQGPLTAADGAVHARVWLRAVPAGTALRIRLEGVAPHEHCRLVAVAADGHRDVAASWVADYEGGVDVAGTTSIPQDRITSLRVETDAAGQLLVIGVRASGSPGP